jgi:hypothetical protein
MLRLLELQNKLSTRLNSPLRAIELIFSILIFAYGEYLLINLGFFILSTFVIIIVLFFIGDTYKRRTNTLDIYHTLVFPVGRTSIINRFLLLDFFEYKSVLIIIHLILISFYYPKAILLTILIISCFSMYQSLHNFIIKRYNLAYNILQGIWGGLPILIVMPAFTISMGFRNSALYENYIRKIEAHLLNNIILCTLVMASVVLIIYLLILYLFKRIIIAHPFIDENIMKKNRI